MRTEQAGWTTAAAPGGAQDPQDRLRQKIEKDPLKATILVMDQGGYRLVP